MAAARQGEAQHQSMGRDQEHSQVPHPLPKPGGMRADPPKFSTQMGP